MSLKFQQVAALCTLFVEILRPNIPVVYHWRRLRLFNYLYIYILFLMCALDVVAFSLFSFCPATIHNCRFFILTRRLHVWYDLRMTPNHCDPRGIEFTPYQPCWGSLHPAAAAPPALDAALLPEDHCCCCRNNRDSQRKRTMSLASKNGGERNAVSSKTGRMFNCSLLKTVSRKRCRKPR